MLLNKIISSLIQIILFALIPFVWWFITSRKQVQFLSWIGLKRVENQNKLSFRLWIMGASLGFILLGAFLLYSLQGIETATSEFSGLGMVVIPTIFVYAVFNTALPEEVLFRGFLLKRLQNIFGFHIANLIQAILFGLLHGAMFLSLVSIIKVGFITLFTGIIAWAMGYINEKQANGSIIPSWIIHSISNLFAGLCSAFLIF